MGAVRYSLEEGANVLGITPKTFKARLDRAGITPTVDPLDRRRLLVTDSDIRSISRLDRMDTATPNSPLGRCIQNVRSVLLWQKQANSKLQAHEDAISSVTQRVQQMEALTTLTLKKVEGLPSAADMRNMSETREALRSFILEVNAAVTECREIEQRIQSRIANFSAEQEDALARQAEIDNTMRTLKADANRLSERLSEMHQDLIRLNSLRDRAAGLAGASR